jgi:hypothetical protein
MTQIHKLVDLVGRTPTGSAGVRERLQRSCLVAPEIVARGLFGWATGRVVAATAGYAQLELEESGRGRAAEIYTRHQGFLVTIQNVFRSARANVTAGAAGLVASDYGKH